MSRYVILGSLLFHVLLVVVLGYRHRYSIFVGDDFCYTRIASYYATGRYDLAITGYWGPMISWLMAPLLQVVPNPFFAGRIVVGLSAILFTIGCLAVWLSLEVPAAGMVIGCWVISIASACWSVKHMTPDLLVGGFLLLGISALMSPGWTRSKVKPIASGLAFGLAYLAKSVALPVTFLVVAGTVALSLAFRLASMRDVLRSASITLAVCALIASPWIATISLKHRKFTFSTSAAINHAINNPDKHGHPFHKKPGAGHLDVMEDPLMSNYEFWSPFASARNLRYQLLMIYQNYRSILRTLSDFDAFGAGLLSLISVTVP
jgi:hypothetical protein